MRCGRRGIALGIPERLVWHSLPDLAGCSYYREITNDKLDILKEADAIFRKK